ncbi:MAG: DUF1553 domain-containing protein [Planctomycetaceae bacterium]
MKHWLPATSFLVGVASLISCASANDLDVIVTRSSAKAAAERKIEPMPLVDDSVFLRRIYVDLIGRIPTDAEVREFATRPVKGRREELVEQLLKDERFSDRWTIFFADMLRLRSQASGGQALIAYVHNAVKTGMPYDELCRRLISTNGKAGRIPEVGFILGDDADPLAMASVTSQVFLGVRIGCAQCHDHPFDVWKRRDFYDMAAFYGKTRRFESQLTKIIYATEADQTTILWPPEGVGPAEERKPIAPRFPFPIDESKNTPGYIKRLAAARQAKIAAIPVAKGPTVDDLLESTSDKVAKATNGKLAEELATADAKKDIRKIDVQKGLYKPSELREQLAQNVTDPRNRYFSRALVNRVWKTLIGRGFVEPVDDFRADNPPAMPEALDYLADEFVASDYDLRTLVRLIVSSEAYQRAHCPTDIDEPTRVMMETQLLATPVRRMIAEAMYDSIVTAGHLFEPKHSPGKNERTIRDIVRVPKGGKPGEISQPVNLAAANKGPAMMAGAGGPAMAAATGYALEDAIELDFNSILKEQGEEEVELDEMKAMSKEELEAQRMAQQRMMRSSTEYEDKVVTRVVDENPVFNSSLRMQSPAPEGHFLRIFGQPNRSDLGDLRDDSASMRQALMMLNGRVTHEAARVGDLEPMYRLLTGKAVNVEKAVQLAYMEILTRQPSSEEITDAKQIIGDAASPLDGMADLRWILMNCNEFRFLP